MPLPIESLEAAPLGERAMTNHDKDLLACCKVDMRALILGAVLSRPTTDFARYDRVIDWSGRLYRAQIKYVSCAASNCQGSVLLHLSKGSRPCYTAQEIDALLVYIAPSDQLCWFGPEVFDGRAHLQIRFMPPLNNQKKCLMASDYLW